MKYDLPKIFSGVEIISSEISDGPMNFDLPEGQENIQKFLAKNKITKPLVTCSQPHKTKITIAENPGRIVGADGILANEDFALGVKTADCVPLMLYDPSSGLIGAIHVSRGNLLAGIIFTSLNNFLCQLLTTNYSFESEPNRGSSLRVEDRLLVFFGPHIRLKNYPVKEEQVAEIKKTAPGRKFLKKIAGKYHFDMTGATRFELEKIGIRAENVFDSGIDTFVSSGFFSSRRAEPNLPIKVFLSVIFKL